MKWNLQNRLLVTIAAVIFLASCDADNSPSTATFETSRLTLTAPAKLTRAIDSEVLFAEINLTYSFAAETTTRTVTASRSGNSNTWNTALDVPANTEFTLVITWYDLMDPERVDLTRLTRTVTAGATDSRIRLVFNFSEFDFSGFDLDSDNVTNLEERENGTSPFLPQEDDPDTDGDGIVDSFPDNCVQTANADQANFDGDALGDVCDEDDDNDGFSDDEDCSPLDAAINPNAIEIQDGLDNDCNGEIDDVSVLDTDDDGILDANDNCPLIANRAQLNSDNDPQGDACDEDDDNDGFSDDEDCGPLDAAVNPNAIEIQDGLDNDCNGEIDDVSVLDTDDDGILDANDNCPLIANRSQLNSDNDAQGDACDDDDDNDGTSDSQDCSPLDAAINPNAVEIQDGLDNNCNDLVDESMPTGLLSGATVDDTDGVFFLGTPPEAVGSITVSPLDDGSQTTIIAGGSIEITVTADKSFSRIYVVSDSTGYFDIQLPRSVREAVVVATSATDMSNLSEARIGVKVESAAGEVSTSQFLPVSLLEVGTGDFQVSVSWDQDTDLDLHLTTPSGDRIYYANEVVGNGMLDLDSNPICLIDGINNENITFSGGQPPAGQYLVEVDYFDNCNIETPTSFLVTVRANGQVQTFRGQLFPADANSGERRRITTVEIR